MRTASCLEWLDWRKWPCLFLLALLLFPAVSRACDGCKRPVAIPNLKETRAKAENGLASAQNTLGWMYREGLGVRQDLSQALKWYRKAAGEGDHEPAVTHGRRIL